MGCRAPRAREPTTTDIGSPHLGLSLVSCWMPEFLVQHRISLRHLILRATLYNLFPWGLDYHCLQFVTQNAPRLILGCMQRSSLIVGAAEY